MPTAAARVAVRPLEAGQVEFTAGLLADWQRRNREVTIPDGIAWLDKAGNFHDLGLVTGERTGDFVGFVFMDSDVYKTLEAVAWELARGPSGPLEQFVRSTVEILERAQDEDGYLDSYYQAVAPEKRYEELSSGHEMYCAGHLIQAGIALARTTGDGSLLRIGRRFADNLVSVFGPGGRVGTPGHPEIETALVELYRYTGEAAYLDLAVRLVDARGQGLLGTGRFGPAYFQDHEPVRDADTVVGHAVRALYLTTGIADIVAEQPDDALFEAMSRQWTSMVRQKMYLTGGVGSRHLDEAFGQPYELPPDLAYNETCAAIASIMWNWRMLLLTGEGRFADVLERSLYNAFAAGTSASGDAFFYVNPLHFRGRGYLPRPDEIVVHGQDLAKRAPWFDCACCPPNVMRLISSLGHYMVTTDDDGIQLQQYFHGTVRTPVGDGGEVILAMETDYPWSGDVGITVQSPPEPEFGISLRIPGWCGDVSVSVNGTGQDATPDARGYVTLRRRWASADRIELRLNMVPRVTVADPRVDAMRGCAAVERGPLVYCIEQADLPDGADVEQVALLGPHVRLLDSGPSDVPGLGPSVRLSLPVAVQDVDVDQPLYRDVREQQRAVPVSAALDVPAIPYFQWANRDPGPMRVWLPYDVRVDGGSGTPETS